MTDEPGLLEECQQLLGRLGVEQKFSAAQLNELIQLLAMRHAEIVRQGLNRRERGKLMHIGYFPNGGEARELDEVQVKQGSAVLVAPYHIWANALYCIQDFAMARKRDDEVLRW